MVRKRIWCQLGVTPNLHIWCQLESFLLDIFQHFVNRMGSVKHSVKGLYGVFENACSSIRLTNSFSVLGKKGPILWVNKNLIINQFFATFQ